MRGGAPRAVWGTTEDDPATTTAAAAARGLSAHGALAHVVWNPLHGEFVQLLPATESAGGLPSPALDRGHSREGRVCLQIQVVAHACAPFTEGPLLGVEALLFWLDTWGIARVWPAGRPGALAATRSAEFTARLWSQGGHFGRSQVPGAVGGGPGAIRPDTLLARPANGHGHTAASEPPMPTPLSLRPRFRAPQEFGAGHPAQSRTWDHQAVPAQVAAAEP